MAELIYAAIASLDGYVEDEKGRSDYFRARLTAHSAGSRVAV